MGALTSRQHAGVEEVDIPSNSVYRYPPKSGEGRARAAGSGGGEGERHGGGPGGPRVGLGAGQVGGRGEMQNGEVSSIPHPGVAALGTAGACGVTEVTLQRGRPRWSSALRQGRAPPARDAALQQLRVWRSIPDRQAPVPALFPGLPHPGRWDS